MTMTPPIAQPRRFTWARSNGYECSSRGDTRFSAFHARLPDGRTIEQHYQCDVKGYDPGGTNWKLGKGKPPKFPMTQSTLWVRYVGLWRKWAEIHQADLTELAELGAAHEYQLTDMFATTRINQARALALLLNERIDAQAARQRKGT